MPGKNTETATIIDNVLIMTCLATKTGCKNLIVVEK